MESIEYKARMNQLYKMLDEKNALGAAKLANSLDWKRASNVRDLNLIAEVFRNVKDYEQELEVLKLAYNKSSSGRAVLENLIKCAIELKNLELAVEYYKEYIRVFPNNTYKFYLKYLLIKMQGASHSDLTKILEEYCGIEHDEKAMFELAYLYHIDGMVNKCVEKCDDIIMWFHPCDESYKAMELKMRHVPLNGFQKEKYHQKHFNEENKHKKNTVPVNTDMDSEIVIPEYPLDGFDSDAFAADLSKEVKSVLQNEDNDTSMIPGQLTLEEMMSELENKKNAAVAGIEQQMFAPDSKSSRSESDLPPYMPLPNPMNDNPYLDEGALLRARTKNISVDKIVNNKSLHKEDLKPKVALSDTQSFNIMKNIESDLASILGKNQSFDENNAENSDIDTDSIENNYENTAENIIPDTNISENTNLQDTDTVEEDFNVEPETTFPVNPEEDFNEIDNAQTTEIYENDSLKEDSLEDEATIKSDFENYNQDDTQDLINTENIDSQSLEGDYTLTSKHLKTLGYFSTIAGFDRALAKAINLLKDGNRCMAISSLSNDDRVTLAQKLLQVAYSDLGNNSLRVAMTTGEAINNKNIDEIFNKIEEGFLIIDRAFEITVPKVEDICFNLKMKPSVGIVICDDEKNLKSLLELNKELETFVDVRIHLPVLTNKELAIFGEEYAAEKGYIIDTAAKQSIYDTIAQLQKGEIVVTVSDIRVLIDKAIKKKNSKVLNLFTKNRSGVNILEENDFI